MNRALIEHPENNVDRGQSGGDQQRFAGERRLKRLCRSLKAAVNSRGQPDLARCLLHGVYRIAQRQTGHAEFRETLLATARQAADCGDTDRLAAAALANHRGLYSAIGTVDRDKVDILELALKRVPRDHPSRPLLLATVAATIVSTAAGRAVAPKPKTYANLEA